MDKKFLETTLSGPKEVLRKKIEFTIVIFDGDFINFFFSNFRKLKTFFYLRPIYQKQDRLRPVSSLGKARRGQGGGKCIEAMQN